jgi:hypothetical protein
MTAPTEAEIREVVFSLDVSQLDIGLWVYDLARPVRYLPPEQDFPAHAPGLWDDLRPSQTARLDALMEEVYDKADAVQAETVAKIQEYIVGAAMQFAAEYPDAPRAVREPVPA